MKRHIWGIAAAAATIAAIVVPAVSQAATPATVSFPLDMTSPGRTEFSVAVPADHGVRVTWDGTDIVAGPISRAEITQVMSSSMAPTPLASCWNALPNTVADVPVGVGLAPATCRTNPGDNLTHHGSNVSLWELVTIGASVGALTESTAGGMGFAGNWVSTSFTVRCVAKSPGISNVTVSVATVPMIYNCEVVIVGGQSPLNWAQFGARVTNYNNPVGAGVTGFALHGS